MPIHDITTAALIVLAVPAAAGAVLLAWLGTLHEVTGWVAAAALIWLALRYVQVVKKNALVLKRQKERQRD